MSFILYTFKNFEIANDNKINIFQCFLFIRFVQILFSELHDRHSDDTSSADREVTKTFNPEAQCFRPIDAVNTSLGALSLSPKTSPQNSPPTSAPSKFHRNFRLNNNLIVFI